MHKRTERLHQLMADHQLKPADVAEILGRSTITVAIWRTKTKFARVIPKDALFRLETKLATDAASRTE